MQTTLSATSVVSVMLRAERVVKDDGEGRESVL